MENAEEIFHFLEDFSKRKPKTIPQELNEYLAYVARTGDPVYQWSLVKCLFKEKLLNVITDFYETSPGIEIPPYPNVDPFNYDTLKNSLIERLESFSSAPFTIQRICELLAFPRKQYNRVDKYMRAIEKNILVVSTREPGTHRHTEAENGEPTINGSDNNSEYNVDVEMEDMSWKESKEQPQNQEPQPSSSESYSIAEIEARLQAKQEFPIDSEEKPTDAFTPMQQSEQSPKKEKESEEKDSEFTSEAVPSTSINDSPSVDIVSTPDKTDKMDVEMKPAEPVSQPITIPEIKITDTSIAEEITTEKSKDEKVEVKEESDVKCKDEIPQTSESNIEPEVKETQDKVMAEVSELLSSSEESSSSSDNTDGNSNSPKALADDHQDEKEQVKPETEKIETTAEEPLKLSNEEPEKSPPAVALQSENYSIIDVNSELSQISTSNSNDSDTQESVESVEDKIETPPTDSEEHKTEMETENKIGSGDTHTEVAESV